MSAFPPGKLFWFAGSSIFDADNSVFDADGSMFDTDADGWFVIVIGCLVISGS